MYGKFGASMTKAAPGGLKRFVPSHTAPSNSLLTERRVTWFFMGDSVNAVNGTSLAESDSRISALKVMPQMAHLRHPSAERTVSNFKSQSAAFVTSCIARSKTDVASSPELITRPPLAL